MRQLNVSLLVRINSTWRLSRIQCRSEGRPKIASGTARARSKTAPENCESLLKGIEGIRSKQGVFEQRVGRTGFKVKVKVKIMGNERTGNAAALILDPDLDWSRTMKR
jgi:hypothetical protein